MWWLPEILGVTVSAKTEVITPRGLSFKQAAAYSGLALWTLRVAVWDGKLPAVKVGRRMIILRDDLDRFLEQSRQIGMEVKP